ncbi:MAG: hypothetical protein JO303_15440 [Caulobacteraceae bacterium]|nr:hypothetical protein [Caulobacteraceae bacterium]
MTILAGLGGVDWDHIEHHWDLHRYQALQRHWSEHGPPVHMAVAAYLGLTRPKPQTVDFADFMASLAPGGGA